MLLQKQNKSINYMFNVLAEGNASPLRFLIAFQALLVTCGTEANAHLIDLSSW